MTDLSDLIIFWAVVGLRFFIPFAIPRYPLPGVLASLIADGIDQTIFQLYTTLPLDNYQGYDKALDIYYLSITYISTYRIWTNMFAFKVDQFFFYYRLFGVTLFELIQFRPLLMIFPNTFEYFFIFYEVVRLKWDPRRLGKRHIILAGALIWILIKLPQEFIIHIAQVDTTDWIGEQFSDGLFSTPIGLAVLGFALALILAASWWLIRRIPEPSWGFTFSADAHLPSTQDLTANTEPQPQRFFNPVLIEKIVIVSLVGVIFAQVLPDIRATTVEIVVGGTLLLLISTFLSQWLIQQGSGWIATTREFLVMLVVNFLLVFVIILLLPTFDGSINLVNVIFFTLLFTVVITMIDHFRKEQTERFATPEMALR